MLSIKLAPLTCILAVLTMVTLIQAAFGAERKIGQPTRSKATVLRPFGYYPTKWRRWEDVQPTRKRSLKKDIGILPRSEVPDVQSESRASAPRMKTPENISRPRGQQPNRGNMQAPSIDSLPPLDENPFQIESGISNPLVPPPALPEDLNEQLNLGPAGNSKNLLLPENKDNLPLPAVDEESKPLIPTPQEPTNDPLEDLFPNSNINTKVYASYKNPLRRSSQEEFELHDSSTPSLRSFRTANDEALKNSIARLDKLPLNKIQNTSSEYPSSKMPNYIGTHVKQGLTMEQSTQPAPAFNAEPKSPRIRQASAVAPMQSKSTSSEAITLRSNPLRENKSPSSQVLILPAKNNRDWKIRRNPLRSE